MECTTSTSPANVSTGGHSSRCHARLRKVTGTRASMTEVPGMTPAGRRSFQELEKSTRLSPGGRRRASAAAISCAYSPTPVRARRAGR
jgi:hypothetical protein